MSPQKYASWAAKDTRESSNLPSDFDGAVVDAKFTKEAPDNYMAEGNPIFGVLSILQDGDGPENERTVTQSYSLGAKAGDEYTISDDGYGLIPSSEDFNGIRKGSKFDLLKCSLENEGVPQTLTEQGDLSKLFGLRGHWKRVDDTKLLGKEREFGNDKRKSKFPPQTLVLVKLLSLPGEKAAGGKANGATTSAVPSQGQAAAAASTDAPLDVVTASYMKSVLEAAKDRRVQRSQMTLLLSKAAMKDGRRQDIGRLGADEAFLVRLASEGIMIGDDIFGVVYDPAAKPQYVSLVQ